MWCQEATEIRVLDRLWLNYGDLESEYDFSQMVRKTGVGSISR